MPRRPEPSPEAPFAPNGVVRWLDDGRVTSVYPSSHVYIHSLTPARPAR